jgi:hypothetical protein
MACMVDCSKCSGYSRQFNIQTPDEYQALVRQLIESLKEGTFLLVLATCPLDEILGPTMPDDIIHHEFQCFVCGRKFELSADTYHGSVHWRPGELPKPQGNSTKRTETLLTFGL